jgi:hypothetical protein
MCFDCGQRPARPGGWRCPDCQARADFKRANSKLAGKKPTSKWRRRLSPVDTLEETPDEVEAGWLPYRD